MLPRLWGEGHFGSVNDASLKYLEGMGFTHVWYTGIIRHSTGKDFVKGNPGSPYAISDYYDVNPYLSYRKANRMSEFESLVKRTHKHGLKVVIDFVPNHLGRDYADGHGGIPHFDYCDFDWTDTFKTDYSDSRTWQAMLAIIRFWASKGVDGFRCDMVEMVPPEFFGWLIKEIRSEYPALIFIAEVYSKDKYGTYIKEVGFDYLYDKSGLYDAVRCIEAGQCSARAITWNWQSLGDLQPNMLNFLENHDEQRIASPYFTGRKKNGAALSVSLLFNQAPFMLYFGEEVGEDASEGCEGRTSIFNFCKTDSLQRLCKSIANSGGSIEKITDESEESVSLLTAEEKAVLRFHHALLGLSRTEEFTDGLNYDLCYCQNEEKGFFRDKHFAFIRSSNDKTKELYYITYLLTANFDDSDAYMTINIPSEAYDFLGISKGRNQKEVSACVKAHSVSIYRLEGGVWKEETMLSETQPRG